MNNLYITGMNGFVGRSIIKKLKFSEKGKNIKLLYTDPAEIELQSKQALREAFSSMQPDYIIHLAAQSFVPLSFEDPKGTFYVNFYGTLNLLEALRDLGFKGRFLYIGSGDMYGLISESQLPVLETNPLQPRNPYAVSKVAAEALCYQWSQTSDIDIVMARPFNHIGVGQSSRFVVPDFAKQVIEIKMGLRFPELVVGNLEVTRDFTDVEDVIMAYFSLLEKGKNGEAYNICSGREVKIYDILSMLLSIENVDAEIVVDPAKVRPVEQRRVYGSYKKLYDATGWEPKISLEETLKKILNYWKEELSNE